MNLNYPYSYINLLAFSKLIKYGEKRSVKIDTLKKYHSIMLKEVLNYLDSKIKSGKEIDDNQRKIKVVIHNSDNLPNFLEKYSNYFILEDNTLKLQEDATYYDIIIIANDLKKEQNIDDIFEICSSNLPLLECLKIDKVRKLLKKYLEVEEELETEYQRLSKKENVGKIKEEIKKLLLIRGLFYVNLNQKPLYVTETYAIEAEQKMGIKYYEYQKFPIDLQRYEKSKYYISPYEDPRADIDEKIYDIYQYAIFGDEKINHEKLCNTINSIYYGNPDDTFEIDVDYEEEDEEDEEDIYLDGEGYELQEEFEEDESEVFLSEEIDLAFYLEYLDKLDNYMKHYGYDKSLVEARYRLLYAIDDFDLCLYEEDKFQKELEKSRELTFKKDEFIYYENEVRYMTEEIFNIEEDQNTIKKLIFISTYYYFTKDREIEEIFIRNKNHKYFTVYSNIVFEKDISKIKRKTLSN